MLTRPHQLLDGQIVQADIAVIGAGAAGIPLAIELARAGKSVALVETGGLRSSSTATNLSRGEVVGTGHAPLHRYRVRALGGTTKVWGGRAAPLDDIDFEVRSYVPDSGWPIRLPDLEPYYRSAHVYLELGRYDYSLPASSPVDDIDTDSFHSNKLWRFSTPVDLGKTWLSFLRASDKINVLLGATCTRLALNESGDHVTSCTIRTMSGVAATVAADEFVLAAGGLEVTRLLLASATPQHPNGIGNNSGHLGRHYVSHLAGHLGPFRWLKEPWIGYRYERDGDGVYCRRTISLKPETQAERALLNFRAAVTPPPMSDPRHGSAVLSAAYLAKRFVLKKIPPEYDAKFGAEQNRAMRRQHIRNVLTRMPELLAFAPWWARRRILAQRKVPSMEAGATQRFYLHFDAEQTPVEESRVRLGGETDALGMPRLVVDWRYKDSDIDSLVATYQLLAKELADAGLAECEEDLNEAAVRIAGELGVGSHHIGTTRMAATVEHGVVDRECRLFGIPNLSIASASTFPTAGVVNPTLTITAIALRIASRLSGMSTLYR